MNVFAGAANSDRSRSPEEYVRELGLAGSAHPAAIGSHPDRSGAEFAAELYHATGGWKSLTRTVLEIAEHTELPADMTSTSFADYVAQLASLPELGLTDSDEKIASLLSQMTSFTKPTALLSLSSIRSLDLGDSSLHDAEGVLMRLQMAGILVLDREESGRKYLHVPVFLAAALRRSASEWENYSSVVDDLAGALVDHLEKSQSVDPQVLADVTDLARRNGLWSVLVRLQETIGLPMFLLAPRAVCAAYSGLPAQVLEQEPELSALSSLADSLLTRQNNVITVETTRDALVEESRSGRMRRFFSETITPGPPQNLAQDEAESPLGCFGKIRRLVGLAQSGDHAQAAQAGLQWSGEHGGHRSLLIIRLLTAISMFHSSEPRRALSILHELELVADERHVDGDFLLPAIGAWTALVATVSGDNERADRHLEWLFDEFSLPNIIGEMVFPATHIAAALRALDRLDLDRARQEYELLAACANLGPLWVYLPVISVSIAILGASTPPELLLSNDCVGRPHDSTSISGKGRDLLGASRSMVHIGLGQLKWAESELEHMSVASDLRIVLSVQVELIAGRYENVVVLADKWFYHQYLTPQSRASLAALKATALLRTGQTAEARAEFLTALGLSIWVNSLLPIASLPRPDRLGLLDLTADAEEWDRAFAVFGGYFRSKDDLFFRLREVGAISVDEASMPQLTDGEAKLLGLLAQGLSIMEISVELQQVTGTVKNRLSALYHKFGVTSRAEVVDQAQLLGFLNS